MAQYRPRVVDQELQRRMALTGAVLIEGPKACGKTATAQRVAATTFRLDIDDAARMAVDLAPDYLFDQPTPILFDEWQVQPNIWNRVRRQVDDHSERGLYILTGSATPNDDVSRHSGAGRFATLNMRPMSLFESGHSSGTVSLESLFSDEAPRTASSQWDLQTVVERIVVGGWPDLLDFGEDDARDWLADYLTQIAEVDIPSLGTQHNPHNIRRLLSALAKNAGQATKKSELARDVGGETGPTAKETLTAYLEALERLHLTDNSPAWQPHMRSRSRLRVAPVRYFVDPSLGPASLNIGSTELLADPNALGFHFEAMVIRDLRIYAQPLRGVVESWRDSTGAEIDAIITLRNNLWGAFEIKLNPAAVDAAAASLIRFADKVDTNKHGKPAVLGVITSTGVAGRRSDGVHVIPIGTLGP